ncbi:MAG: 23S rRNA (guanosine(2251)-2'-O)-methyltransferase RlmB [Clostridia bacterium]|nr:23S rRNA (guanosine(2251)-2'-O)-methyltransferase RlmB [Clostridia bacterium]
MPDFKEKEEIFETESNEDARFTDVIVGRNPVTEALRSGREIDKLLVAHGAMNGSVRALVAKCRERGIPVKEVAPQKLDFMSGGASHQGVALVVASHEYCEVGDILDYAAERNEAPFIIICDGIEDPHNLGAIIRTAEACGVHGIIIPKRRSASLNAVVAKASAGALEYMRVARVTNITACIDELKEKGLWIYAADMDGENWCSVDYRGACAFVIGSEGRGVSSLVKKSCDVTVAMPMMGKINSLNASVAAGVLMYEAARQKQGIKANN